MPAASISQQNEVTSCKAGVRAYELLTRYFRLIAEGNLNVVRGTASAETVLAWSVCLQTSFFYSSAHIYRCMTARLQTGNSKISEEYIKRNCETDSNRT